ncbi:MAG TPA: HAMP domain-containing protein, partial [Azospirillaceae bacterium]|nr:HAMP domain-containing protein [Azospirillaceae bacterium]
MAWSRIIPDGIAARIALTVVVTLVVAQALSVVILFASRGHPEAGEHPSALLRRVAAIVQFIENTPAADRGRVLQDFDDPVLTVEWRPDRPALGEDRDEFPYTWIRRRLRAALDDPARPILIAVERPPRLGPPLPIGGHRAHEERPHLGLVRVGVALKDGSWLTFTASDERDGPVRLVPFVVWMALIGLLIVALSWWAARRLTAPLERFAQAAERLGLDGDAPPLEETGPRELRTTIRAFNRMQQRLTRFVDDRTQMLAAISHDLRTPLTRLRLRAELIGDGEQQRKMLADLDDMEAMITSTLAFARDDARKEPRAAIDLADLLQSLVEERADAGFEATYDGPVHRVFSCRPMALKRALANLMDNAINYGARARVRLEEGGGQVVIDIDDDGPGIPESERE